MTFVFLKSVLILQSIKRLVSCSYIKNNWTYNPKSEVTITLSQRNKKIIYLDVIKITLSTKKGSLYDELNRILKILINS